MKAHSAPSGISRIALVAIILAQCEPSSFAGVDIADQFSASPAQLASTLSLSVPCDFDGDLRLDEAELHLAGLRRCVRIRFGNSREVHLELDATPQMHGVLLIRDINQDNKTDLIWVYHSELEPPEAWLGDGLGHFAKSADKSTGTGLRALALGDPNPGLVGDSRNERVFLTPDPPSPALACGAIPGDEIANKLLIAWHTEHRKLGEYLSYLRERGPPLHPFPRVTLI